MEQRTISAKPAEAAQTRAWWVVDAEGKPLGRLASKIAMVLRGKHKPIFTPHVDTGDFVVVVNADKVVLTGKKETQKEYMTYSQYPGKEKIVNAKSLRAKHPELMIERAVKGMIPHKAMKNH